MWTSILEMVLILATAIFLVIVLARGANQKPGSVKVYLAGTMSGNSNNGIVNQDYRERLTELLKDRYPSVEIDNPYLGNENSITYNDAQARITFNDFIRRASYESDVMIAYLPEASMGTALEIYEASKRGNYVIIITPLTNNWIVRLYGNRVFSSIESFAACLFSGEFDSVIYSTVNDFDGTRSWNS